MPTIASLAERLDMTAEEAVEKLRYMLIDVESVESEITNDQVDLLIDVDEDPSIADQVRDKRLKERERARKAAQKAAAKRKAAPKKPAAKKPAAKPRARKKTAAETEVEAVAETAAGQVAEILPAAGRPVVEILGAPVTPAVKPAAEAAPAEPAPVPRKVQKKPPKKKEKKAEGPAIVIGTAIEHERSRAEIIRADGTHLDVLEAVELVEPIIPEPEEEEEEIGLLAEAERRQEEEERRKARLAAKPAAKPDPAVVAEVIRRAAQQRELVAATKIKGRGKSKAQRASAPVAGRKTGKTARKRQKRLEKLRFEETMRRDAAAAVREYQAGGFDLAKKRRKKRVRESEDGRDTGLEEQQYIDIEETMTVEQLARAMDVDVTDVILELMERNILATKNQALSIDVVRAIAEPRGFEVRTVIPEEEELLAETPDNPADLVPRAPVVTVMGHVDHGKTSLLDRVRKASVAAGEVGGITQHIAAYEVELPQGRVVFLDTPGHEAFTAMRARGAQITDVVVLVVAADDGIMPQTVEAIDHARAAEVPIVVAINKIDKPNAQPDRVRQELTRYDLTDEKWGGKTIVKEISALTGQGVDELMELLVLETELLELKANPKKRARGAIVESEITRGMGPAAWVLVRNGTLRLGDSFLAGHTYGRVRTMHNAAGQALAEAGPSTPVVVTGFSAPPNAGDLFVAVEDERTARAVAEKRAELDKKRTGPAAKHVTLEDFHNRLLAGEKPELNIVLKADVQGSVDVLQTRLSKLGNEDVRCRIVHAGVGGINESDVLLASASDAVIIGFQVSASPKVEKLAQSEGVAIRTFEIIYELIENVRMALEGLLAPEQREVVTGHVEIRKIFRSSALGNIAGCFVLDGEVRRDSLARVKRGNDVVYEGRLASLRRERDDVASVQAGFECGIKLDNFEAIQEGDIIEAYRMESVAKSLN